MNRRTDNTVTKCTEEQTKQLPNEQKDRQYNYQMNRRTDNTVTKSTEEQTKQLPKETWTDNTTTKRNIDRQYNDQKKNGQTIQRPKEEGQTIQ